jgi:hypothetical protein
MAVCNCPVRAICHTCTVEEWEKWEHVRKRVARLSKTAGDRVSSFQTMRDMSEEGVQRRSSHLVQR